MPAFVYAPGTGKRTQNARTSSRMRASSESFCMTVRNSLSAWGRALRSAGNWNSVIRPATAAIQAASRSIPGSRCPRGEDPAPRARRGEVEQQHVVVRAAGHQVEAVLDQRLRQDLRVPHDLRSVGLELGPHRLAQGDGDRRGGVVVRAALQAGEDGAVDLLVEFGGLGQAAV